MIRSIIQGLWILAIMVSALNVVYYRHANRVLYAQLQKSEQNRDDLYVDWTRLLLELGALSNHARIDNVAHAELDMRAPTPKEIYYLKP